MIATLIPATQWKMDCLKVELAYPNPCIQINLTLWIHHTAAPLQSIHSYGSIDMAVLRPLVVWQEGCISPEMAPLSFIASILELGHVSHASLTLSSHLPLTH
jgi:hypothetical protein